MKALNNIFTALKIVYVDKRQLFFSFVVAFIVFSSNALIRNYSLLFDDFSLTLAFRLIVATPATISYVSLLFLSLIAILSGVVVSMTIHLLTRQIKSSGAVGLSGILFGILAPACPSCALGILGLVGLGGVVTILPFKGLELGFVGVAVLFFSLYYLSKKVTTTVCPVK